MAEIPRDLVTAVRKNRAIAFIGSGLSVPAGGPTWKQLITDLIATGEDRGRSRDKLIQACDALLAEDCVRAATAVTDAFPKSARGELERAIVQAMNFHRELRLEPTPSQSERLIARSGEPRKRTWQPTESHRLLLKLNLQGIITTNYDKVIERAISPERDDVASYSSGSFNHAHANLVWKQFILHLHGSIDDPGDIVFSRYDYRKALSSEALRYLGSLLNISVTLMIGFGHGDPDVAAALKQAGCTIGYQYQLVRRDDTDLLRRLDRTGVTPILLDSYDEVPGFLYQLLCESTTDEDSHDRSATNSAERTATALRGDKITDCFLAPALGKLPEDVLDPKIRSNGQESRPDRQELFREWAQGGPKPVAIVAPAGAGKSVLLAAFAQWLKNHRRTLSVAGSGHRPLILYLGPDNLPRSLKYEPLLKQVEQWAGAVTSGYLTAHSKELLKPWLDSGAVYLLFDGLDELGMQQKGEVYHLLGQLAALAQHKQAHVFLTCRETFWGRQIDEADRDPWQVVEIRPLEAADLRDRLPNGLGPFAYDHAGRLKPGVLNPLILSFLLALRQNDSTQQFQSRQKLYQEWAVFAIQRECIRSKSSLSPAVWYRLFQETALSLLRTLSVAVPLPRLDGEVSVPYDECMAMEILIPSADRTSVKFRHESFNEFFVTSVLANDFRRIVDPAVETSEMLPLSLSSVDLDFLQPSFYGFLHEALGTAHLDELIARFRDPNIFQCDPRYSKLHRNIVEFAGMTCGPSQELERPTDWLLDLIRAEALDPVVRYNAARALERIHFLGPRPYFDYMSDWGERSWREVRRRAEEQALRPWAIRGYRIRQGGKRDERKPGAYPDLAVVPGAKIDHELQRRVSNRLGAFIVQFIGELTHPDTDRIHPENLHDRRLLLINSTYAWVRWYHPDDQELLLEARRLTDESQFPEASANLEQWVGHSSFAV